MKSERKQITIQEWERLKYEICSLKGNWIEKCCQGTWKDQDDMLCFLAFLAIVKKEIKLWVLTNKLNYINH